MLRPNKFIVTAFILVAFAVVGARFLTKRSPVALPLPARQITTLHPETPPQTALEPTPAAARIVAAPAQEIALHAPIAAPLKHDNHQPAPGKNIPPTQPPHQLDQDPDARAALRFVGADPDAEAYWATAINDPDLPAEERRNLIEDLNEDGLSNPDHPSAEDLPLILNRIEMIKSLAPYAMDQVNSDAFAEAYKDLIQMLADGG